MRLPYVNKPYTKSGLKRLVTWSLAHHGRQKTLILVERLKEMGFAYATHAGISLGIEDLLIPPSKSPIVATAEAQLREHADDVDRDYLTPLQYFGRVISVWTGTNEAIKNELLAAFRNSDTLNPVYMMAFSGARGNISQIRQLVGMRGLMSDPNGQIIDFAVRSNFREGLTLTEYIIACYGSRKGVVDTALKTATSGYLTRRLVDVAQHVVVADYDCHSRRGLSVRRLDAGGRVLLDLRARLVGRVLSRELYVGDVRLRRNQEIDHVTASTLGQITSVPLRSPLTCALKNHVCQLCYGWNLSLGRLVSVGETVGVMAAQSIGEPGTQLTMRTFHTGGVFSGDTSREIRSPVSGVIDFPEPCAGLCVRTPIGRVAYLIKNASLMIVRDGSSAPSVLTLPSHSLIYVKQGQTVRGRDVLGEAGAAISGTNDASRRLLSSDRGEVKMALGLQAGPYPKHRQDLEWRGRVVHREQVLRDGEWPSPVTLKLRRRQEQERAVTMSTAYRSHFWVARAERQTFLQPGRCLLRPGDRFEPGAPLRGVVARAVRSFWRTSSQVRNVFVAPSVFPYGRNHDGRCLITPRPRGHDGHGGHGQHGRQRPRQTTYRRQRLPSIGQEFGLSNGRGSSKQAPERVSLRLLRETPTVKHIRSWHGACDRCHDTYVIPWHQSFLSSDQDPDGVQRSHVIQGQTSVAAGVGPLMMLLPSCHDFDSHNTIITLLVLDFIRPDTGGWIMDLLMSGPIRPDTDDCFGPITSIGTDLTSPGVSHQLRYVPGLEISHRYLFQRKRWARPLSWRGPLRAASLPAVFHWWGTFALDLLNDGYRWCEEEDLFDQTCQAAYGRFKFWPNPIQNASDQLLPRLFTFPSVSFFDEDLVEWQEEGMPIMHLYYMQTMRWAATRSRVGGPRILGVLSMLNLIMDHFNFDPRGFDRNDGPRLFYPTITGDRGVSHRRTIHSTPTAVADRVPLLAAYAPAESTPPRPTPDVGFNTMARPRVIADRRGRRSVQQRDRHAGRLGLRHVQPRRVNTDRAFDVNRRRTEVAPIVTRRHLRDNLVIDARNVEGRNRGRPTLPSTVRRSMTYVQRLHLVRNSGPVGIIVPTGRRSRFDVTWGRLQSQPVRPETRRHSATTLVATGVKPRSTSTAVTHGSYAVVRGRREDPTYLHSARPRLHMQDTHGNDRAMLGPWRHLGGLFFKPSSGRLRLRHDLVGTSDDARRQESVPISDRSGSVLRLRTSGMTQPAALAYLTAKSDGGNRQHDSALPILRHGDRILVQVHRFFQRDYVKGRRFFRQRWRRTPPVTPATASVYDQPWPRYQPNLNVSSEHRDRVANLGLTRNGWCRHGWRGWDFDTPSILGISRIGTRPMSGITKTGDWKPTTDASRFQRAPTRIGRLLSVLRSGVFQSTHRSTVAQNVQGSHRKTGGDVSRPLACKQRPFRLTRHSVQGPESLWSTLKLDRAYDSQSTDYHPRLATSPKVEVNLRGSVDLDRRDGALCLMRDHTCQPRIYRRSGAGVHVVRRKLTLGPTGPARCSGELLDVAPMTITPSTPWLTNLRSQVRAESRYLTSTCLIQYRRGSEHRSVRVGDYVKPKTPIDRGVYLRHGGQIILASATRLTLRRATHHRIPTYGQCVLVPDEFVNRQAPLVTVRYRNLTTEDIVQGIPKIEHLFEARRTGQQVALPALLTRIFNDYGGAVAMDPASRENILYRSLQAVQQFAMNAVQNVYQSQGVNIADKHLEIILRQMTAKVSITYPGDSGLLFGDLVYIGWLQHLRTYDSVVFRYPDPRSLYQPALYIPTINGITRTALDAEGFLAAASFQETARVLCHTAILGRRDFLRGLKGNVILGSTLPMGTQMLSAMFAPGLRMQRDQNTPSRVRNASASSGVTRPRDAGLATRKDRSRAAKPIGCSSKFFERTSEVWERALAKQGRKRKPHPTQSQTNPLPGRRPTFALLTTFGRPDEARVYSRSDKGDPVKFVTNFTPASRSLPTPVARPLLGRKVLPPWRVASTVTDWVRLRHRPGRPHNAQSPPPKNYIAYRVAVGGWLLNNLRGQRLRFKGLRYFTTGQSLRYFATGQGFRRFATGQTLRYFVTEQGLRYFATGQGLRRFATEQGLRWFGIGQNVRWFATGQDPCKRPFRRFKAQHRGKLLASGDLYPRYRFFPTPDLWFHQGLYLTQAHNRLLRPSRRQQGARVANLGVGNRSAGLSDYSFKATLGAWSQPWYNRMVARVKERVSTNRGTDRVWIIYRAGARSRSPIRIDSNAKRSVPAERKYGSNGDRQYRWKLEP